MGRGPYQVQALVAACHARAKTVAETDWGRVAALYAELATLTPSPYIELSRAIAVAMDQGPAAGLPLLDALRRPRAPSTDTTSSRPPRRTSCAAWDATSKLPTPTGAPSNSSPTTPNADSSFAASPKSAKQPDNREPPTDYRPRATLRPHTPEAGSMKLGIHISNFTFGVPAQEFAASLARIVTDAEAAGFDRLSLMDHYFQIPGVGPVENEMLEALHRPRLPRRPDRAHRRSACWSPASPTATPASWPRR